MNFLFLGVAMTIVAFSNVVTGADLETAPHIQRFIGLWLVIGLSVVIYELWVFGNRLINLTLSRKLILSALMFVVLSSAIGDTFLGPHGLQALVAFEAIPMPPSERRLLEWLDEQSTNPVVIWVEPHNTRLTTKIVLDTKHYVLFDGQGNGGAIQLVPSDEVQERYLVASALSGLTLEKIAEEHFMFGGNGYARNTAPTRNREIKYCELLQPMFGNDCSQRVDNTKLYLPLYQNLYTKYVQQIKPNLLERLKAFHVTFIVKDSLIDTGFSPETLGGRLDYFDGRYSVFRI